MEERKSPLKNIGCAVWGIYLISVMIFAPYYNWKFAQQAGFVPWLFGGEIVGTFKGVLWPCFLWSDHKDSVRKQQARAYFDALYGVGKQHKPLGDLMNEAIARADERAKILGNAEGKKQLESNFEEIRRLVHTDLDNASAIVPPPFLVEFHKQIIDANRQMGELFDQMLAAYIADDEVRKKSLSAEVEQIGNRISERLKQQLADLGLDQ